MLCVCTLLFPACMWQELGENVIVSMYAPKSKRAGLNLLLIWLVAVATVAIGAYWSGLIRHRL
jgi:hypothetical protein